MKWLDFFNEFFYLFELDGKPSEAGGDYGGGGKIQVTLWRLRVHAHPWEVHRNSGIFHSRKNGLSYFSTCNVRMVLTFLTILKLTNFLQTAIGADIMMQLDDVVDATHDDPERFEEARKRTVRWLDRCIEAHKRFV